jgi:hypothetical protein
VVRRAGNGHWQDRRAAREAFDRRGRLADDGGSSRPAGAPTGRYWDVATA